MSTGSVPADTECAAALRHWCARVPRAGAAVDTLWARGDDGNYSPHPLAPPGLGFKTPSAPLSMGDTHASQDDGRKRFAARAAPNRGDKPRARPFYMQALALAVAVEYQQRKLGRPQGPHSERRLARLAIQTALRHHPRGRLNDPCSETSALAIDPTDVSGNFTDSVLTKPAGWPSH